MLNQSTVLTSAKNFSIDKSLSLFFKFFINLFCRLYTQVEPNMEVELMTPIKTRGDIKRQMLK